MALSSRDNYTTGSFQASQYYIHNYYVNTYYYVYKFLEKWIASNIFRNDKSRVFMSSDDYCFRRRFELTDTSQDYSTLEFSSLRPPFANYWPQNNAWTIDPRIAAKSAALTYIGIYEGNTKVRAAQSLFRIPTTFWFDREDDARLAYDALYFRSYNEHYYEIQVPYGRNNTIEGADSSISSDILNLPMNMEITELTFNPEFKETDWLKKQRLFPIKVEFRIRSYAILPPEQPDYTLSLNPNGSLSDGSQYESGFSFYYIVDDVILNLNKKDTRKVLTFDAGYNESDSSYDGTIKFPEKGELNTIYIDSHLNESDKNSKNIIPTNLYVWDDVNQKYVSPDYDTDVFSLRYFDSYEKGNLNITRFDCISKVTPNSNVIEWSYGEGTTSDDIQSIELHLSNFDIINIDPKLTSYKLIDLVSHSQYYGYIIFYSKDGSSKRFIVNFITPMTKQDEINKKGSLNSLVGLKI